MEQHYAATNYVDDLEALIKDHQMRIVSLSAEQEAAKPYEIKLKAECDSLAENIKKIDADENLHLDESLKQQRKDLWEELIFKWRKLKWFTDRIAECESKAQEIRVELHALFMQRLHVAVAHNK